MTRWAAIRVRLYLPDANPLRRRADRIEAVVVAALLALGVLAVLPAVLLGLHVHERATADARAGRWVVVRVVEPAGGMYGLPTVTWERADGCAGRAV
ncbi:MAG: hypothetical protein HOY71_49820, partial [Nonomuraea sp.]|nr:hypothetical protein [Nonomuraea sp.]